MGKEEYGLNIEQVVSIERMHPITAVPKIPEHFVGVINLHGIVTPVLDLRKALLNSNIKEAESTRIVVVNVDGKPVGLIVDGATEVLNVPGDSIQDPQITSSVKTTFLTGIANVDERLLILLDVELLLNNMNVLAELREMKFN